KKFLNVINESQIELSEDKIKTDARWDGLHAVITSIKDLSSEEVYDFYHGLWQVEETFRISKHDLSMRPIFHYKSERIHAHIAICFMALLCVRHLEYRAKVQKPKLSLRNIRGILLSTQISVIKDISTDISYAIPSKPTSESQQLYSLVGKTLSSVPFSLGKLKR
ncbi:MAG: transposase, partial [Akkermansia sp.]